MIRGFATFAFAAALSEDEEFDAGLSLLQRRVQKLETDQEPTYFTKGFGEQCDEGEILTAAQCFEVLYKKTDIPNNGIQAWSILPNYRSLPGWPLPNGCYMDSVQRLGWNDEPVGSGSRHYQPICSRVGGRAAEIASNGQECEEPTCLQPGVHHRSNWVGGDVVVPELELKGPGELCDEGCGILSYAQCAKAADTGLIEALTGRAVVHYPMFQCSGGGHARPLTPSGCSVTGANMVPSFCPYDTPDGELAELVSDSGVGVSDGTRRPICGKCTTTTTTDAPAAPPAGDDAAAAVGDPHLSKTGSGKGDMCCHGGHCGPCP